MQLVNSSTLALNGHNVYAWDSTAGAQVHLNSLFAPGVNRISYGSGTLQLFANLGPYVWNSTGSGDWSAGGNWAPDFAPDGDEAVIFGSGVSGPTTITVDNDFQVGEFVFNNSSHSYTIAGDGSHELELVGQARVNVAAGSHTINAPLTGVDGLTKTGSGTLRLSGGSTYLGPTTISAGTVRAAAAANFGQSNLIEVAAGATLDLTDPAAFALGANRTLTGCGSVLANVLAIPESSVLGGTLQITGSVANAGRVAPGFSPGIITIIGNYSQQPTGVLEMEIGGTVPGSQHDMLIVTGTAFLSGRLETPIIDGFIPQAGDEMQLVLASNVIGDFDSHASPNLAAVNPNVAYEVETTSNGVRLRFVAPSTSNGFDGTAATTNWSDVNNWIAGVVPTSRDVISVENQSSVDQRLDVEELVSLPNSKNAFTHRLTIAGDDQMMAVTVQEGSSLSATVGVTVENQGEIELDGGTVVTSTLKVDAGGAMVGSGAVVGHMVVGAGPRETAALFSPGTGVGSVSVSGDYSQGENGHLVLEVASAALHDSIAVAGNAALGGVATVVVTDEMAVGPGTIIEVVRAATLTEGAEFEDVLTTGSSAVRFVPVYENLAGVGLSAVTGLSTVTLEGHPVGDVNLDGIFNPANSASVAADAAALALAFVDPDAYRFADFNNSLTPHTIMGRVNDDDYFDFDDIRKFRELAGISMAQMMAAIQAARGVPEPSTAVMALLVVAVAGKWRRRPPNLSQSA